MNIEYSDLFQDSIIHKQIGWDRFYEITYKEQIKKNESKIRQGIKKIINFISDIYSLKHNHKPNIVIWGNKFIKIIDEQSENYNFFIFSNSIKELQTIKWGVGRYPFITNQWQRKIDRSFISHDMKFAKEAIEEIQSFIISKRIRLVFLGNDKLFIERALKIAAENIGVPVVIIQHGIYGVESFRLVKAADTANHFWVWSEYMRDLYQEYINRPEVDIQIIGYPLYFLKSPRPSSPNILFLGNQYFNYNEEEGKGYLQISKTVKKICDNKGWKYRYRPHPSEIIDNRYDFSEIKQGIPLQEDVNWANVVIGDISSSMIEAAIIGRPVVQIIWSERSKSANDDPIYSFTIKCDSTEEGISQALQTALNFDTKADIIDPYYLFINDNFSVDIDKLLYRLLNN